MGEVDWFILVLLFRLALLSSCLSQLLPPLPQSLYVFSSESWGHHCLTTLVVDQAFPFKRVDFKVVATPVELKEISFTGRSAILP